MLRQFLKDSAIYGAARLLVQGISLFLIPVYTRVLSPAEYGMLDMLTVFASLVTLTVALEVSQGVARYFPDTESADDRIGYASTSLWFTLGAYTVFAMVALPFASALSEWLLESDKHQSLVRVAVLSIWGNGLFYLVHNQLRWALQPKLYTVAGIAYSLVSLGMAVVLVLVFQLGVVGFFVGQLLGSMVGVGMGLYFARHSYRWHFDYGKLREMLRFSVPLVPASVGVFVTLYIDRIAIKELMTLADVGVFGIGYRLAAMVGLLMVGIQGALTPLVYTHYRRAETPGELARIFRYFMVLALLVCLGITMFSREILVVFSTPDYYAAAAIVPLLAAAILLSNMYIFAPGLDIAKRTGVSAGLRIMGAGLNTGLNFALIPLWGIWGAALATFLSALLIFAAYMVFSQRLYFVPHSWRPLGLAVLAATGVFLVSTQVNIAAWADILVKLGLLGVAAWAFTQVGLIDAAEVRRGFAYLRPVRPTSAA